MSFPSTSVLDNCARGNENPLSHGGSWSMPINIGDYNAQLLSNVITSVGTGWFSTYWNAFTAADCEVFTQLVAAGPGTDFKLWWRVTNPNAAGLSGYRANFHPSSDTIVLEKRAGGSFSTLTTLSSITHNLGDTIGVRMAGSVMTFWVNGTQAGTYTDSAIAGAGYIGCEAFYNTGDGFASFGGGVFVGLDKVGHAITGGVGTGASASLFVEAGKAIAGGVGSGAKLLSGTTAKTGKGIAGSTATGASVHVVGGTGTGTATSNVLGPVVSIPTYTYQNLVPSYDLDNVVNRCTATRDGGSPQTWEDVASQDDYFLRAKQIQTLVSTDAEALNQAQWKISQFSQPLDRIEEITIMPLIDLDNSAQIDAGFGRELGDRISIVETPPGMTVQEEDYVIQHMQGHIDIGPITSATLTFQVWPASLLAFWIAGDSERSVAGVSTKPAY